MLKFYAVYRAENGKWIFTAKQWAKGPIAARRAVAEAYKLDTGFLMARLIETA